MSESYEPRALELWKQPEYWAGQHWDGWYVGLGQHRDSGTVDRSNFRVFVTTLNQLPYVETAEGDATIHVVREGHWAVGWVEWVAIHPANEEAVKLADEMMCALSDYPILDDSDLSALEWEEMVETWCFYSLRDRIHLCAKVGLSIFAARRSEPSYELRGYILGG